MKQADLTQAQPAPNLDLSHEPEIAIQLADLQKEPKVKIVVHERQNASDPTDVYVGVNGVVFIIKRGEHVEVPLSVAMVLERARQTRYEFVKDEHGRTREMRAREAPAYPFSWLSGRPAEVLTPVLAGGRG